MHFKTVPFDGTTAARAGLTCSHILRDFPQSLSGVFFIGNCCSIVQRNACGANAVVATPRPLIGSSFFHPDCPCDCYAFAFSSTIARLFRSNTADQLRCLSSVLQHGGWGGALAVCALSNVKGDKACSRSTFRPSLLHNRPHTDTHTQTHTQTHTHTQRHTDTQTHTLSLSLSLSLSPAPLSQF